MHFGVLDEVVTMVRLGHVWAKDVWKKKVWKRAWELDECYWRVQVMYHRSLDFLSATCGGRKYTVWWQIADNNHSLMRWCETMIKLISHASLLKGDDVRFKGRPPSARFCDLRELGSLDDVRHLVLQCPGLQMLRNKMFMELEVMDGAEISLTPQMIYCIPY